MSATKRVRIAACTGFLIVTTVFARPASVATSQLPRDSVYQLPVTLVDQRGVIFDWSALRGKPRVVSMFYTSCQFVCPLIIDAGKAVEKRLSPTQREHLGFVVISMDPKRDSVGALNRVATQRGLDAAHWTLASPHPRDVRYVAGLLGVRYRKLADGGFNHSTVLVLLDGDGRVIASTEKVGGVVDQVFLSKVIRVAAGRETPAVVSH